MFKKFLAAMAAIMLAVTMFGAATAAPAQAASNTTVAFVAAESSVDHLRIKVTGMNDVVYTLGLGQSRRGVKKVCPPNSTTVLTYRNPRGGQHSLAPGQCTGVSLGGTYQFSLFTDDWS